MLWPERITQQSSRPFDPVESFRPPRHEGCNKILDEDMQMSSEIIRFRYARYLPIADMPLCTANVRSGLKADMRCRIIRSCRPMSRCVARATKQICHPVPKTTV